MQHKKDAEQRDDCKMKLRLCISRAVFQVLRKDMIDEGGSSSICFDAL